MLLGALKGIIDTQHIEKDKVIWSGNYPPIETGFCDVQYYKSMTDFCLYKFCCCIMSTVHYSINRSKIDMSTNPPCLYKCCREVTEIEYAFR